MASEEQQRAWAAATGKHRAAIRKRMRAGEQFTCYRCGDVIEDGQAWDIDHGQALAHDGELLDPTNLHTSHATCNRSHGGRIGAARAKATRKARARLKVVGAQGDRYSGPAAPIPMSPARNPTQRRKSTGDDVKPAVLQRVWPTTFGETVGTPGPNDCPPLHFSDPHPDAVGSHIDAVLPTIQRRLGFKLRWWQRACLSRMLEFDRHGDLCWARLVLSAPRQTGKSILTVAMALARCEHPTLFGPGPQSVVHVGRTLAVPRLLQSRQWNHYAPLDGHHVDRGRGSECIEWPDGSAWRLLAASAVFGHTASLGIADEAWDLDPLVVDSGLWPTLATADSGQLLVTSTANLSATPLMLTLREVAAQPGQDSTCHLEWGVAPGEDPTDERVWRASSPYWDSKRRKMIALSLDDTARSVEFLNAWSESQPVAKAEGLLDGDAWDALAVPALPGPVGPVVGVIEGRRDGGYSAALAWKTADDRIAVSGSTALPNIDAAMTVVTSTGTTPMLVAGLSLVHSGVLPRGWDVTGYGGRETKTAGMLLRSLVSDRAIVHVADAVLDDQVRTAKVSLSEDGATLSGRRSGVDVSLLKCVGWAVLHLSDHASPANLPKPAIW